MAVTFSILDQHSFLLNLEAENANIFRNGQLGNGMVITGGRKRWHCHALAVSASVKVLTKVNHVGNPK